MSSKTKEDQWNKAHSWCESDDSNIPSRLYTDENPATTIKGTGFKNERIARRTIELTSQPGVRYKQYCTIRAMRERAFHHPYKSKGMLDAINVFDEWLENYQEASSEEKQMYKQEWETFRRLCQSTANKHSYGKEPTREELKRARDDLLDGQRLLLELLTCRKKMSSKLFPLTSFVAIFGGPGIHGYGSHSIDSEEAVSKIIINGMDGIEELIGATKASKLMIDNVTKVEVTYNRVYESSMTTTIIRSKQSNTLENLWEKAAADSCRSNNLSSGRKKRQRDDNDHTKEEGIKLSAEWTCNACTFIHIGISKRDFLACELCGSTRTECQDNI